MRKILTLAVWLAFGMGMAALGYYTGMRRQHSAAMIRDAREIMKLRAYADKYEDSELSRYLDNALNAYSTELDKYTNGRGLNAEQRDAVRLAREEIARFQSARRDSTGALHR
jgi:hypothetical protein